jgi:hypothetical protein
MKPIIGSLGLILITSMISCSKSAGNKTAQLVVDLHQSAITIDNIDSADVVFRQTGTNIIVKQRFVKTAQNLTVSLQSLTQGSWNTDIEVYTKATNQQSNQYVFIKPIDITGEAIDVQVAGPGANSGNGWAKRHVKASAGNEVVVIVPDDVYDSYFEFRSKVKEPLIFGIQREAINTNYLVDQKTWTCTNACLNAEGRIADINQFMPFTQSIRSATWTKAGINIGVFNERSEELLTYDRTWNH